MGLFLKTFSHIIVLPPINLSVLVVHTVPTTKHTTHNSFISNHITHFYVTNIILDIKEIQKEKKEIILDSKETNKDNQEITKESKEMNFDNKEMNKEC